METFDLVLMVLAVVLLSAVLDQLLTRLALPLVQIMIGALLAAVVGEPLHITTSPELFLVLFIAPLLFDESRKINKQLFVRNLGGILSLAIGLVIVSALAVGFITNWLAPTIPLAGAFALGAMLGPTDAAAVTALSRSLQLNTRQKSLLSGEALINDASGIVSFQFAVAALTTGAFSLAQATGSFALSFFGGLGTGAVLGLLAVVILRSVRAIGLESTVFHVVFEVLTPFIIFLVTEEIHASGILGVVAAGLVMTLFPQLRSSYQARVKLVSSSVWEVLTFVINGVVFVLLGVQLPYAIEHSWEDATNPISLVGMILAITFISVAMRFGWMLAMEISHQKKMRKKKGNGPVGKVLTRQMLRDASVTTFAGPKGAVTLSISFTLPAMINGELFAQRDELIFLASGVILLTLLLANFVVPLLAPKAEDNADEQQQLVRVHVDILNKVVRSLREQSTATTALPVSIVVNEYRMQIRELAEDDERTPALQQLRTEVIADQEIYLQEMKDAETIDPETARICSVILRRNLTLATTGKFRGTFGALLRSQAQQLMGRTQRSREAIESARRSGKTRDAQILLEVRAVQFLGELADCDESERAEAASRLKAEHEVLLRMYRRQRQMTGDAQGRPTGDRPQLWDSVRAVEEEGFRLELGFIQEKYEAGDLTRAQATRLRDNVYLLQLNSAESGH